MLPENLKYSKDHEWVRIENQFAYIGITNFAQGELGDIVYVDINTVGDSLSVGEVFGSVEAVKTVSDLYLPVNGKIIEVNSQLDSKPELINSDPYGDGWIVKVELESNADLDNLLDAKDYKEHIGK